jgi:predicted MFS family arabinose efflux permease
MAGGPSDSRQTLEVRPERAGFEIPDHGSILASVLSFCDGVDTTFVVVLPPLPSNAARFDPRHVVASSIKQTEPGEDRRPGTGVLVAACVSTLVVNANTSAVTILLPSISNDVHAPVAQLQWAVTGYSLVAAAVIVTSGALGDVLGRRKIFIAGLALFVASCGLIALSTGAAGPLIGGVLDSSVGWQGLFWIDAVIAAICIPVTLKTVVESRDRNRSRSIDWAGTALIALILAPVILALSKGNDWGWASAATIGCFVVSIVGACLWRSSGACRRRSSTSTCCEIAFSSGRRSRS